MKETICAWCGEPATKPLCHACYEKALGVPKLSAKELDDLPYGAITLDAQGTVLSFNRAEEQFSGYSRGQVTGKNFFSDVAPCTKVRAFQIRFRSFLRGTKRLEQFRFDYRFKSGKVGVHLVFVRVAVEEALVMIRKTVS